jgi:hypothetical protein
MNSKNSSSTPSCPSSRQEDVEPSQGAAVTHYDPEDKDFGSTAQARYDAAVERLTAQEWKRKYQE